MRDFRGVTVVELLVVLGIIGLLLGLLMPAVHISRERAREVLCKNNIYQVTSGVVQYQLTHKKRRESIVQTRLAVGLWMSCHSSSNRILQPHRKGTNVQRSNPEFLRVPPTILQCPRTTILDKADETQLWARALHVGVLRRWQDHRRRV